MDHRWSALVVAALAALMPCPALSADEGEETAAVETSAHESEKLHWRDDPSLARRPGSYIGGSVSYVNSRAWAPENDDHDDLTFGPLHGYGLSFRVGDAFADWIAVGFQVFIATRKAQGQQISAVELLLDFTFYPAGGLGLRPSVGIGFGFGTGENDWEFSGDGPGCFSFAALYEFRVLRLFSLAPMVSVSWVGGDEFDALFITVGLEISKWFQTATG